MKFKTNEEQNKKICELYLSRISRKDIQTEFNISDPTLSTILKRNNVKQTRNILPKKYFFNFDFFESIDCESKAYFLGLLYADGNIFKNKISISLQEEDKHILATFQECINLNKKLTIIDKSKSNPNWKVQYGISISSPKMVKDLYYLGCMERKTQLIRLSIQDQISSNLFHHFIRGYFDGDGSIWAANPNAFHASFTSNHRFIDDLNIFFQSSGIHFWKRNGQNGDFAQLETGGNLQCLRLFSFLYKDSNIFMHRKFNKFMDIIRINPNKYLNYLSSIDYNNKLISHL